MSSSLPQRLLLLHSRTRSPAESLPELPFSLPLTQIYLLQREHFSKSKRWFDISPQWNCFHNCGAVSSERKSSALMISVQHHSQVHSQRGLNNIFSTKTLNRIVCPSWIRTSSFREGKIRKSYNFPNHRDNAQQCYCWGDYQFWRFWTRPRV